MQSNGLSQPYTRGQALPELLKQRILILDGAMGTMIQQYKLSEADYRGLPNNTRFADHPGDIKGNNELLVLTHAHIIIPKPPLVALAMEPIVGEILEHEDRQPSPCCRHRNVKQVIFINPNRGRKDHAAGQKPGNTAAKTHQQ